MIAREVGERFAGSRPLTRFAPSPTGYLHLGHVANAAFVWGIARAIGGRVLFRLEDHDQGRCRPAAGDTGIRDLRAAGVSPGVVLGQAAYLTGLSETPRSLRAQDLASLFDPC
jgi:glutamyl/glutaminyl-tRNA synthetase